MTFIDRIKSHCYIRVSSSTIIIHPWRKNMAAKRGQPPKAPEKKRTMYSVYLSQEEKAEVEEAKEIESPDLRMGAYVRESAIKHCRNVIRKANKNKK
jgi:hypothetical protein